MESRELFFDQVTSLAGILKNAGVPRHGTATLILQGVGRRPAQFGQPMLSFCPAQALNVNVEEDDSTEEGIEQDFPSELEMTDRLRDQIIDAELKLGFFRLSLTVNTNGKMLLDGDILESESVEEGVIVYDADSYDKFLETSTTELVGAES